MVVDGVADQVSRNVLDEGADNQDGNFFALPFVLRVLRGVDKFLQERFEFFSLLPKSLLLLSFFSVNSLLQRYLTLLLIIVVSFRVILLTLREVHSSQPGVFSSTFLVTEHVVHD